METSILITASEEINKLGYKSKVVEEGCLISIPRMHTAQLVNFLKRGDMFKCIQSMVNGDDKIIIIMDLSKDKDFPFDLNAVLWEIPGFNNYKYVNNYGDSNWSFRIINRGIIVNVAMDESGLDLRIIISKNPIG